MKNPFAPTIMSENAQPKLARRIEQTVISLVKWTFLLTLPLWLFGLVLALIKAEFKPLLAMGILCALSIYFFRQMILTPLLRRIKSKV